MNPYTNDWGDKYWRNEKGQLHRVDGPAMQHANGYKAWYINGLWHREDGPAIEYQDGSKEWYFYGQWVRCETQEEFERIIKLRMFW